MSLAWLSISFSDLFIAIGYFILDFNIYIIGILITIPMLFFINSLIDSISTGAIKSYKIAIFSIIGTLTAFTAFMDQSVILTESKLGEIHSQVNSYFSIFSSLIFIFISFLWFYYMLRVYFAAPRTIKKYAFINLIGAFFAGILSGLLFATGVVWIYPGLDYLSISIGALLTSYAFYKEPKLGYVLPFKVYTLIVISNKANIPLYTYHWNKTDGFDEVLFSGAMIAVGTILSESLNTGRIAQILFEDATLITQSEKSFDLSIALLVSHYRPILAHGLNIFMNKFVEKYRDKLDKNLNITSEFENSFDILNDAFPFVVS